MAEEDDDFYSAANWAEFADPDALDTAILPSDAVNSADAVAVGSLPGKVPTSTRTQDTSPRQQPSAESERIGSRSRSQDRRVSPGRSNRNFRRDDYRGNRSRSRSSDQRRTNYRKRSRSPSPHQSRQEPGNHRQQGKGGNYARPRKDLELFNIYRGIVARVQDYGCFVKLEDVQCRDGLVHISHYLEEVPRAGDRIYCKVISISESPNGQRISLSIKLVDQRTGKDLDPHNEQVDERKTSRRENGRDNHENSSESLPTLYAIYKGKVNKIESFGCFIALDGYRKQGLCHISQLAEYKVEAVDDAVSLGQEVYVKVISLGEEDNVRISLSMKYCSQSDGTDLDPGHGNASMDAVRGKSNPLSKAPIVVGDSLDPMMQFMNKGSSKGKEGYEFVLEEEDKQSLNHTHDSARLAPVGRGRGSTLPSWMTEEGGPQASQERQSQPKTSHKSSKKHKKHKDKKEKKEKKEKKDKKHKKEKKSKRDKKKLRSDSSDSSDSDSGRYSNDMSDLEWGAAP